jgi:hypothetical protein
MVRSSISEEERRAWNRVLGVGFVVVVAGSAALSAVAGGATLAETALVTGVGLTMGTGLAWYLSTLSTTGGADREHRER